MRCPPGFWVESAESALKSLKKTLNNWQWRNLTVLGKIQIIKTFAMSKLLFRASVLTFDKDFKKNIYSGDYIAVNT